MTAAAKRDARLNVGNMFGRLDTAVSSSYAHDKVPGWIEKHTYLGGRNFSFKGHEYQLDILKSEKRVQYVKKCSQVGVSEIMVRKALAVSYMIPDFSTIITQPTTGAASMFSRTRLDPTIANAPLLKDALDSNVDSSELKKIGTSYIYIRGTFSQNAAISIPAHYLVHDEVDFSDQDALTSFQSRLTHSPYKWQTHFSTPTLPKFGIDGLFQNSNRWFKFCKCNHCNHQFIPSYLTDVIVPGFNDDILMIDKGRLAFTRWREAYLACPKCKKQPDLGEQYREMVCENPNEQHEADGYQVSPFDAPSFISVQDLMSTRTRYERTTDFVNFSLGLCQEDHLSGIQEADLDMMLAAYSGNLVGNVIGIDMGQTIHYAVAGIDGGSTMDFGELGTINFKRIDEELTKLVARTNPIAIVMDALPFTETVVRLQRLFPNLYAGLYVNAAGLRAFKMMDEEEDKTKAILDERQININRDIALDFLMEDIRGMRVGVNPAQDHNTILSWRKQMRDMRRLRYGDPKKPDNERYRWVKSKDKNDHFHHAMLYAWVASKLRLAMAPRVILPTTSLISKFKVKRSL